MYLIDNPNNATEKKANAETLQFAEELRVQREVAIKNGKFSTMTRNTKSFLQYLDAIVMKRKGKKEFYNWRTLYDMLLEFSNGRLTFEMLDKKFCADFRDYLVNKQSAKTGEKLKPNKTKTEHCKNVLEQVCLRCKYGSEGWYDIIMRSPLLAVKAPPMQQIEKVFLTIDELRKLANTDCKNSTLKRAFLFACLTGLRWSDISKLEWKEVQFISDTDCRIVFTQQKTKGLNYLPLPLQCVDLLGEPKSPEGKTFSLGYSDDISRSLQAWCRKAGITKKVTFHTARHTFAVSQLNLGTEIYTLQKLLGHSSIQSAMVYANITDEKKVEAMVRMPNIIQTQENMMMF